MRLREIYTEKPSRTKEASIDDIIANSPVAWEYFENHQYDIPLYRGIRGKSNTILHGDTKNPRNIVSYGSRIFVKLTSYSKVWREKWEKFPNRYTSWICSSNVHEAGTYGQVYYVFPVGDPEMAICPKNDFWFSFSQELHDVTDISYLIDNVTRANNVKIDMAIYGYEEVTKKDVENYIDGRVGGDKDAVNARPRSLNDKSSRILNGFLESDSNNLLNYLGELYSPERNGFKLMNLSQYLNDSSIHEGPENHEVWFSGPAYFYDVNS